MHILAIIQTHPNQPNAQAPTTGFPNLEHRFTLLGDVLDVSSARSMIDDIEKTIKANLKLIEQYVNSTQETRFDFQTVYADDDIAIPNSTHVCGAITSVIHEISEISETVEDLHLIAKKRQA